MSISKRSQSILWKGLAFLLLLMVPMLVWATQEEKKKENPPPPKVQQQKQAPAQRQQAPAQRQQAPAQRQQAPAQREQAPAQRQQAPAQRQQAPAQREQAPAQRQQAPAQRQQARTLTPTESRQQIQNLNSNRAAMKGINRNPLPQGQVTVRGDGGRTIAASGGRQFQVRPNGTVERVSLSGGRTAAFRPDGRVSAIHAGGMQINHGLRGERQIVTVRPDHSRVVSMGARRGYLERPYLARGGRTYVQRTYYAGGHSYARVYRSHYYRGVPYYHYVPPYYYHPRFYGWAYNPWRAPIRYRWGWFGSPWYSYYGGYFAPAPMYPTAALWLTDFLLAENLRLAYEARRDAEANAAAAQANEPPPPAAEGQGYTSQITPELKQAIAEEVSAQLAAEQQGASTTPQQPAASSTEAPPGALDPGRRLFVVSSNLTVSTIDGQDCELTSGDIITRLDDTPDNDNKVRVSVSSSKGGDCGVGSTLMVDVNDLQEMQNQFAEKIDTGLKTLADNSGKGGLPPAPDTGTTAGEVPLPPPDANVDSALQAQQQQADQTEKQVQQEAAQGAQNYY